MSSRNEIRRQQEALPIFDHRDALMDAIRNEDILIIVGEPGSGKTTQLPRYLIEEFKDMRIGVTQPRRIAAISVSKRVAEEYDCKLGDTVGYAIRFDDNTTSRTRLKYMTDGVLLREATMDPLLEKYDLIIIDEAHERSVETDVLFGLLKRTRAKRPNLKLLIMSATLDVMKFSDYFDSCSIYTIKGRAYPVEILHSRNTNKLGAQKSGYAAKSVETVMHILDKEIRPDEVGDILVFLTGQHEIERACQDLKTAVLEREREYKESSSAKSNNGSNRPVSLDQLQILPLYASLDLLDQTAIFGPTPRNSRKIIFATNIAQTSVTIPNIRFVVDSGFVKQKMYDPSTGMDALLVVPISKAAATQRAGRAGRTRAGVCFRLYSRESFETEMDEETVPEIKRTGLTGTVLSLKRLGIVDVNGFEFLDRPGDEELSAALRELYLIGGIDQHGRMTDIGHGMVAYPVSPLLARSLIEAEKIGCLDNAITIVAMLSVEEPFHLPRKEEEHDVATAAHAAFYHRSGDHMTLLNIFEAWREARYSKEWCRDNYFNIRQLRLAKSIRSQLQDIVDRNASRDKGSKKQNTKDRQSRHQSPAPSNAGHSNEKPSSQSSSSSRSLLQAFSQGYGIHLSKKHIHRQMFYHYLASTFSSSGAGGASASSLLALHISPLSALYLDDERSMTKHGRKVSADLEWIFYHEVVYHAKAVMRYVSKTDVRWVQDIMDRAKIYDRGQVWLNGGQSSEESGEEHDKTKGGDDGSIVSSTNKRELTGTSVADESDEQAKKRARLEMVEAARRRALERRQNL
ncbi:DEAH-box ATP-dependent RNA helicase prp22 [Entomortierella chlamydospora]|nr:DEAH-box ATP-dependent RNA helicase prp22 [Entomortierella chlamydospora]